MRIQRFSGNGVPHKTLLELFQAEGIFLPADCGGRGVCGKCRVRFLSGAPEAVEEEIERLSPEQLEEGIRLACRTRPKGAFAVEWEQNEEAIEVESIDIPEEASTGNGAGRTDRGKGNRRVAVDIGTTTIAAALVDAQSGQVLAAETGINHQRSFGADVISRIQATNDGKGEELRQLAERDIRNLITNLGEDPETVPTVIAGNTTMEHLLRGLSCTTLGVVPFTPVDISLHRERNRLFLPGISTFIGADIVSGIVSVGMDVSNEICMLIDLGTNGEMAIGNKEKILTASTAAGPAFEGGNISCGVAGIPGAISRVTITDGKVAYETIGGKEPVGLCGTGVLEVMYELLKEEIVDETGLMDDGYVEEGYSVAGDIVFTDKDIREVQLAKSAIRAGAETLMKEFGVGYGDVSRLYLAGGFGQKIDLTKAAGIGILPKELVGKTVAVGNSSLSGAIMVAAEESVSERFLKAISVASEVGLSDSVIFQDLFMQHMFFE